MILKSREIEIIKDDPYKNDALNRKETGEALTEFVLSANDSVVVCIDAPWGQGKTTFLRMWEQHLKNNDIPTIYFNAWESDFSDDALICLIGEISASITELSKTGDESKAREYLGKTKDIGIALLKRSVPVAAKIATAGALDLDKVTEQALAGLAESIAKEQLERYENSKKSIKSFRKAISQLASQGGIPLCLYLNQITTLSEM
ncbi:KAP family P-loop NTPase fold protein [Shewanella algae]|uniref:KAP family P-loop NTPase fold protein n=1 Tax=Shewanella algae TaxID=38313 RepID=UPI003AB05EBB